MTTTKVPNGIILFGYPQSPYTRRVEAYLALRNIPYAECIQPHILPRPDLAALGIRYRRIPVLAIGRDVYVDSRAILRRLEELFPASEQHPALSSPETKGVAALLNRFVVDPNGVFTTATKFITPDSPMMQDPKFRKDRQGFLGPGSFATGKKEAVTQMRQCFDVMESMLQDGREWIAGTRKLGIADLEGVWPLDWLLSSLKPPTEIFNDREFPRTFAWIARYRATVKEAKQRALKPVRLTGDEAFDYVSGADFTDHDSQIDDSDPLRLKAGTLVEVYPLDGGGQSHEDRGRLVKLVKNEVAIAVQAKNGREIRVHAPRWNFKVKKIGGNARL